MAKRRRVRTDGRPRLDRPKIKGAQSVVWYIVWREGGRSQRASTGTPDEAVAQERLTRWLAARARPRDIITVNQTLDLYISSLELRGAKSVASIKSALKPVREYFGPVAPSEVSATYVRQYTPWRRQRVRRAGVKPARDEKPRPVSDRMISVELAYLRAALKLAADDGAIIQAPKVKLPKNAGVRRRKRFLTDEEIGRLIAAADSDVTEPHMRLVVKLALMTAQRGIAIRALKWEHVDWDAGVIWFSKTDPDPAANKQRQDIPITPLVARLLGQAQDVARSDWVIEWRDGPVSSVKKGFRALVTRAGIAGVTFHDLRRTVATQGIRRGHSWDKVAALLGDDVRIVREHYAHVSPIFLAEVMPTLALESPGAE